MLIRGCFTNGVFFLPLMSLPFIPEDGSSDGDYSQVRKKRDGQTIHKIPFCSQHGAHCFSFQILRHVCRAWCCLGTLPVKIAVGPEPSLEFHPNSFSITKLVPNNFPHNESFLDWLQMACYLWWIYGRKYWHMKPLTMYTISFLDISKWFNDYRHFNMRLLNM